MKMWQGVVRKIGRSSERLSGSGQLLFVRLMSGSELEPRHGRTRAGWISRTGSKPGLPNVHVEKMRRVGVDKNLQERLDDMYFEEREATRNRRNIGFEAKNGSQKRKIRMDDFRKKQRADPTLERAARHNTLQVDVEEVKRETVACGAHFEDVAAAADLYGVFDDLYGPDLMFRPCVDLKVAYEMPDDEECVLPVHRGNVLKPSDAVKQPEVEFSYGEQEGDDDSLWTLVMTNPDGHFEEDEAEYLHWMVANISGQGGVADLATSGDTICPYLQPFPPYGTGFHRFVFVLYKQKTKLDLSEYQQSSDPTAGVNLRSRTFRSRQFFEAHDVTPSGLAFFQSDYDTTLHKFFHDVLDMKEPKYEYNFATPYVEPWDDEWTNPGTESFNLYLDQFRDPKDQQEEILKKRLKSIHPYEGDLDRQIKYPNAHHPRAFKKEFNTKDSSWRIREIERERLRRGVYKDMDHVDPRKDPTFA